MARKKNPNIGKYTARYEYDITNEGDLDYMPEVYATPEEAMDEYLSGGGAACGEVIYVYKLIAVKKIVQPAFAAEDYVPEVAE